MTRFGFGYLSSGGTPGNDSFTKILLHMDGSNGSTTFTDVNAGGSSHVWTPTNATISNLSAKFGSTSMLTSAGYISTPAHADFNIGTNDFAVDFWFNNNGVAGSSGYGLCGQSDSVGNLGTQSFFIIRAGATGPIFVSLVSSGVGSVSSLTGTTGFSGTSGWHHIALTKAGTTFRLFIDGVQEATTTLSSINTSSRPFTIGRSGDSGTASSASLDEFRYTVGSPRWTANFTPPTSAYV